MVSDINRIDNCALVHQSVGYISGETEAIGACKVVKETTLDITDLLPHISIALTAK